VKHNEYYTKKYDIVYFQNPDSAEGISLDDLKKIEASEKYTLFHIFLAFMAFFELRNSILFRLLLYYQSLRIVEHAVLPTTLSVQY
jgi:hypothetical protein